MRITVRYALPLALALMSAPAAAQRLPGAIPEDPSRMGAAKAEYNRDVLQEHDRLMRQWMNAWSQQDKDEAARAYAADATVVFGADRAAGRAGLEGWLARNVAEIGDLRTALSDFRASGALAYAQGTFQYQLRSAAAAAPVTGSYFAVLVMERGRWKYQTQVFLPDAPAAAAPAPATAVAPPAPTEQAAAGN
ncbi:MAG TPA: nuclear transport factor 2 family protein [Longimicrobium sp.]|nr:nuclear transport factor 2 family protein [Longimicrobium sp.]